MKINQARNTFIMRAPDDWHVHPRQGALRDYLVGAFIDSGWRHRIASEPNTQPPILTGPQAVQYSREIGEIAKRYTFGQHLESVPIIQITEETIPATVREAFSLGVKIGKVYPRYVTTHSENGVVDYRKIYPALEAFEELGGVVQFHGEHPSYDVIGRLKESAFRRILDNIRETFSSLKISVEHVSSADMVTWIFDQPPNVVGGVTVQHLYVTADDLAGYSERSKGLICVHDGGFKPGAKDPPDRQKLQEAVLLGTPKFFYASDCAAHWRSKKECLRGMCGAFNAIPGLSMLASFFDKHGCLEKLEPFVSEFGASFYGFPLNRETILMLRNPWVVPLECRVPGTSETLVPFFAGETMEWSL